MRRILTVILTLATLLPALGQEIVTLANVAELKAADPRLIGRRDGDGVARATVHLRGYATDSDGGGGELSWLDGSDAAADDGLVFESESAYQDGRWQRSRTAGYVTPAMFGMFGLEGVGQSLLSVADSRMTTNTYSGTTGWSEFTNNFASFAVGSGKMTFTLRASPGGSQSVQLSGFGIRSPGLGEASARYLVRVTARVTAGSAVELAIGKSFATGGMAFRFTPTNTATVFTGYFTGGDTTQSLYLGLATNNASNGSSYEIDDVEIYYAGDNSTLTEVPDAEDAPDEGDRFQAMLDSARGAPGRFEFPPNRIYRADGGGFVAWDGAQIALNNSELYLSGIAGVSGLRFTSYGTLTRGKLRGAYAASASDKGLVQAGVSQSEASPVGRIVMSDLFIADDTTNTHASLLIFGSHNAEVRNIEFADTAFTRRQVNVVWAGSSTLVLGYNPAVNVLIENIYAGNSGQNFPAEGGGCVVGINGIVNCSIRNVYAESVGRSLVDLGTGDWYDTRFAPPLLNSSLATCVIDNCSVANANIGFRVDGTAYLATTKFAPLNVSIRNCFSRSSGGYLGTTYDAGVLVNPSIANLTVSASHFIGHKHGIQVTNQFVSPSADAWSRDLMFDGNVIRDSQYAGIYLIGATDTRIERNHIYNSGTQAASGQRQAVWIYDYNTNVVIRANVIGEVNETATNQTTGIEIRSTARNHAISVADNWIMGTAAAGTPISYGASATYAIKGLNYTGSEISFASTTSALSPASLTLGGVQVSTWDEANTADSYMASRSLGSSLAGHTIGGLWPSTSTYTLVDNYVHFFAVWVPRAATLSGVKFVLNTQGNYTADQNNEIGLYSYSAGSLTRVAVTSNNGDLWKAAGDTLTTATFSASYQAAAGLYFVALVYNSSAQTTAPVIKCLPPMGAGIPALDFSNSAKVSGRTNPANSAPASQAMSGLTVRQELPWLILY